MQGEIQVFMNDKWCTQSGDTKQILVLMENNRYKFPDLGVVDLVALVLGWSKWSVISIIQGVIMGNVKQIPDLSPPTRGTNCTPCC